MTQDQILIVKRNGAKEALNLDKIHNMLYKACDGLTGVSVSDIAMRAKLSFYNGMSSKEIHTALIKSAADLISEDGVNYQYVAGNLLNYELRKTAWGSMEPPRLYDHVVKMVENEFYTPELLDLYSEADFDRMDGFIDHDRDFKMTYIGLNEYMNKYAIRDRTLEEFTPLETPQITYMLIAALSVLDTREIRDIKSMYNDFSQWNISLPTPIMAGLRGVVKQFSSCTLVDAGDSIEGITAANEAIIKYSAKRAGIGVNASAIRAEGDSVGLGGTTKHTGVIPFLRSFEGALKSSAQGSIRGSSACVYLAIWHYEVMDLLVLKNNKGTPDSRVRKMDYGFQINNYLYNRLIDGKNITLFSPSQKETPGLYEAFFDKDPSKFIKLYEKYEKDPKIRKRTVNSHELFSSFITERKETGRIYVFNVDNVNQNSTYKVPISMSNLCLTGDTRISTSLGIKTLKELYDSQEEFNVDSDIRAYEGNEILGDYGKFRVRGTIMEKSSRVFMTNPSAQTYRLTVTGENEVYSLNGTLDHKVMTPGGFKAIGEFNLGDEVYLKSGFDTVTGFGTVTELSIGTIEPVYDITVENSHSFIANGIVVHNCAEITLPTTPLNSFEEEIVTVKNDELVEFLQKTNEDLYTHKYEILNSVDDSVNVKITRDKGLLALCTLSAINLGNVKNLDDLESICKNSVRALDNLLDYQDYMVPAARRHSMLYRPLGIGITNLAYYLAKNGFKYSDSGAFELIHDTMEAISFYCIKASIDLAKERGPCIGYSDTTWSDGILPIDRYNKNVDQITNPKLKLDWEWLRKQLEDHGIRNASLTAAMPAESSSRIFNSTNGVEPVRSLITVKSNKDHISKQVVPEFSRLKNKYDLLWDMKDMDGIIKMMAVIQKFTCQSISSNTSYNPEHYENGEIPMSILIGDLLKSNYFGLKTLYYNNIRDGVEDTVVEDAQELPPLQGIDENNEDDVCDSCSI